MAISAVEFGTGGIGGADAPVKAVKQWSEILRLLRERIEGIEASVSGASVGRAIAIVLMEIGGYDCVVVWRVDGSLLAPVSAAFASDIEPPAGALARLAANPLSLEASGLEVAVPRDGDAATTGRLGCGGPMESVLGRHSYALAAVKRSHYPAVVLQAIYREQRTDLRDRDLLVSFAQLLAAVTAEPGATELLNRCREWALTRAQAIGDEDQAEWPDAPTAPSPPVEDEASLVLPGLTSREREVVGYAMTGATYHEIADALFISVATIHSHMRSILRKLSLHSRVELIARYASVPVEHGNADSGHDATEDRAVSADSARLVARHSESPSDLAARG
jgi:DNA-binding CsgD family transcriptional regulator